MAEITASQYGDRDRINKRAEDQMAMNINDIAARFYFPKGKINRFKKTNCFFFNLVYIRRSCTNLLSNNTNRTPETATLLERGDQEFLFQSEGEWPSNSYPIHEEIGSR
jgi:hypothetical protein